MAPHGNIPPAKRESGKGRKLFWLALKLAVSGTLLLVVLSRTGIRTVTATLGTIHLPSFLIASLVYILSIYLSSVRWHFLLPEGLGRKRLFSFYLIGSFFNNFLPGIIGGDAVKAYYLNAELKGQRAGSDEQGDPTTNQAGYASHSPSSSTRHSSVSTAIASVFMDRYVGFAAMMLIGLVAYPFGFQYFRGSYIEWLLPLIIALFIVGSLLVLFLKIGSGLSLVSGVYDYFAFYKNRPGVILKTFCLSLVIQASGIIAVSIISRGLGLDIPLLPLLIFIPIISTLSTLPISISGLGVREASFVLLLGFLEIDPAHATAVSLAWFFSVAVASISGLVEYLRYKRKTD